MFSSLFCIHNEETFNRWSEGKKQNIRLLQSWTITVCNRIMYHASRVFQRKVLRPRSKLSFISRLSRLLSVMQSAKYSELHAEFVFTIGPNNVNLTNRAL